jgi:hypothetical protein
MAWLPHQQFDQKFLSTVKGWLQSARARSAPQEVWAIMHFDQREASVETFHSHSGTETMIYKQQLDRMRSVNPGPQSYGLNSALADLSTRSIMLGLPSVAQIYADMHAEEELIAAFPRVYQDWIADHPWPGYCCIYLNFSPCLRSGAKLINGTSYPQGCLHKLAHLAALYQQKLFFYVYYDKNFGQPTKTEYDAALGAMDKNKFMAVIPMPAELQATTATQYDPTLFSPLLP